MSRAIDHLVLCVNDLDAAIAAYGKLGFTVTPRATHPFGTGNALIQLDGMYIELLSVVEPAKINETDISAPFSFAVYNRDYLRHREGMSMLALQSRDAQKDRDDFIAAGAAVPRVFDFERDGKTPQGDDVSLAFSLAFAIHPLLRNAVSFVCQHRHPSQNFYFPEYQTHENTARKIGKVLLSHWAADAVREFYEAIEVDTVIESLHADELIDKYGIDDPDFSTDGFAGFELIVDDMAKIADAAKSFGAIAKKDKLILPPSKFFGVMVVISGK
ncbi:VOC family protein [Thalassospira lucentensis]|uniref:VOC family protein n=1 Tax=Thalassospira lucentensis TaxID=168935 RepID=UPI00142E037C|nr:VOC family protein [Thalassospira lucentensis]NIZ02426.1 VOC family protein [Thalassospira lucentensis]